MSEGSAASGLDSSTSVPVAPKIELPPGLTIDVSFVDLFDAYAKDNDLKVSDQEPEDTITHHRYPVIMQSMLTRLEKFGRLANMKDLARHSKNSRIKKQKVEGQESGSEESDPNDMYYDLDDTFIAPEDCDLERDNEDEFDQALTEGFHVLKPEDFVPQVSRPASLSQRQKKQSNAKSQANIPGRKKKARQMSSYPEDIRRVMLALQELYEKNRQETTAVAFPKGASKLINEALEKTLSDPVMFI